jgi:D-alanyl-D-alanine carboxypeptidase (penicillin-binding protein 5/6)
MYLIAKEALANDHIKQISSKYGKTMPATNVSDIRYLYNTNPLLNSYSYYYYEGAIGLKTGTTDKAGCCLISSATKDGYTYIAISMKGVNNYYAAGEGRNTAFLMCRYMLKWAFSNMKMKLLADSSYNVGEVAVKFGRGADYVGLVPQKDVSCVVHKDVDFDDLKIEYGKDFPKEVDAPIKQGEKVGKATLSYNGVKVSNITLVAQQSVKKNYIWAMFSWVEKLMSSKAFVITFILVIIGLIAYLVLTKNERERRKRRKNSIEVVKDYSKLSK